MTALGSSRRRFVLDLEGVALAAAEQEEEEEGDDE